MARVLGTKRQETVAVIGLGYVGLPLAVVAARAGFRVVGIDHNPNRVAKLNRGINTLRDAPSLNDDIAKKIAIFTIRPAAVRRSNIVIVCVPTPVDKNYVPDLSPVKDAAGAIARYLQPGQLIILESTVNPGVCEEVVLPILEQSGLRAGWDFDLAHCPERINPGDSKWHVGNIPRCVGATTVSGAKRAAAFYARITTGQVRVMKSLKEAEATKIVENSFRDINIAFVNELARSFDKLGIDVKDVIDGAATKPFSFLAHYPSIGVGGHCIPVDPYYLIERAHRAGFDHKFLRLAREINNAMPSYALENLQGLLNRLRLPVAGTKVTVLGLSYKADVGDIRESPSLKFIERLRELDAKVTVYDPYFPDRSDARSLTAALRYATACVITVNHKEFLSVTPRQLRTAGVKVVIDGKNCWPKQSIIKTGILYKGIGR